MRSAACVCVCVCVVVGAGACTKAASLPLLSDISLYTPAFLLFNYRYRPSPMNCVLAEHVKQRMTDTARLQQRNKNVLGVLEGRQGAEEREIITQIKASLLVPRSALQFRPRIDTGRVKAKAMSYGDGLVSGADLIAQRERQRREMESPAGGGGGGQQSYR